MRHIEAKRSLSAIQANAAVKKTCHRRPVSINLLSDLLACVEATIVVGFALLAKIAYIDGYLGQPAPVLPYLGLSILMASFLFAASKNLGLYEPSTLLNPHIILGKKLLAVLLAFLLIGALLYLLKISEQYSRGWVLIWLVSSYLGLVTMRVTTGLYVGHLISEGRLRRRIAIYGAGELGQEVQRHLEEKCPNVEIIGLFDDDFPKEEQDGLSASSGDLNSLIGRGRVNTIDDIIVALPISAKERIHDVVDQLSSLPSNIQICPSFVQLPEQIHAIEKLGSFYIHLIKPKPLTERALLVKSAMDYTLGVILLVATLPLFLIIAAAIKLDSKGPVFFRQRRHGYNHEVVNVYKFRTMTTVDDGPIIRQAKKNDNRITRVGGFLRRTSLDELPQLLNVMAGGMSLVGPRPHAVAHNEYYEIRLPTYSWRHRVKPGITGWAQANGYRGETNHPELMQRRVEHDLYYIDNWSIRLDFEILLRTLIVVFTGRNAH